MITWTEKTIRDEELAAFAKRVRSDLRLVHVEHDPEFLTVKQESFGERAYFLVDEEEGRVWGIASFRLNQAYFDFGAGGLVLFRSRAQKFSMSEGPVTARPDQEAALLECFTVLAQRLPKDGVVYVGSVEIDSPLHRLLMMQSKAIVRHFYVLQWGEKHRRFKIRWTGSYDDYLKALGQSTRSNIRRVVKKLRRDPELAMTVRRFQTVDDIPDFLKDGEVVSEHTYHTQLGLGLTDDEKNQSWYRFAAEKGYFLAHIMYLKGKPVAFQYGYVFGGTFLVLQIGHDPLWSKYQLGMALFAESLRDIEERRDSIEIIDWGSGTTMLKERICGNRYEDAYFYLFPKTFRGAVLFFTARINNVLIELLKALLRKFKVKGKIEEVLQEKTGHGHLR